jgi:hypothetical protein
MAFLNIFVVVIILTVLSSNQICHCQLFSDGVENFGPSLSFAAGGAPAFKGNGYQALGIAPSSASSGSPMGLLFQQGTGGSGTYRNSGYAPYSQGYYQQNQGGYANGYQNNGYSGSGGYGSPNNYGNSLSSLFG